jgi:thiamine-monophosphate kinase
MEVGPVDEFALISSLTGKLSKEASDVTVGIGDDTAVVIFPAGEEVLLTTDTMVEGVHFLHEIMDAFDVGFKCVAASISDIAAMGGNAKHVLISIAIPNTYETKWLGEMYDGIQAVCDMFACHVVGGDVVHTSGPLVVTSTVTGSVLKGHALLRRGAKPGDVVFVTGTVGGSAAGLYLLQNKVFAPVDEQLQLLQFHRRPTPQIQAGQILCDVGASSCNDISDGLASELNEIAKASSVRMRIEEGRIPIAPSTRNLARTAGQNPYTFAWYGGEDYQLVGTASPYVFARALSRCESMGIKLTQIGRVEPGDGVVAGHVDGSLELVLPKGYNHFA